MRRDWIVAVLVVGICLLGSWASRGPPGFQFSEDTGSSMFQKRMLRASDVRCAYDLRSPDRLLDQAGRGSGETGEQTMDLRAISNVNYYHLVSFEEPDSEEQTLSGGGGLGNPTVTSALVINVHGGSDFDVNCSAQSPPTGDPAFPRCSANGGSAESPDKVSSCSAQPTSGSQICSVQPNPPTPASFYNCSVVTYNGAGPVPWSGVPTCSTNDSSQRNNHAGFCSVFAQGHVVPDGNTMACSVFPSSASNACSVRGGGTSPHKSMTCRVTGAAGAAGDTLSGCSVVVGRDTGPLSSCSVVENNRRNSHRSMMSLSPAQEINQLCSVQQVQDQKQGSCSVVAATDDTSPVRTWSVRSRPIGDGAVANCSVLDPSSPPPTNPGSVATCSVIGGGGVDQSYCSVFQVPTGEKSNTIKCSVFYADGGDPGPFNPGVRRCSTYAGHAGSNGPVQPSRCSVIVPQTGGGVTVLPPGPDGKCVPSLPQP